MFKKKAILGEYIAHLVLGAVMFTALLVLSGMVNLAVHWIGNFVGDPQFAAVMTLVERVMLYSSLSAAASFDFLSGFIKGAKETPKGYFAPAIALWRCLVGVSESLIKDKDIS